MSYAPLFGYFAAIVTSIAFMPQVIKTWKTKNTKDISLGMYVLFCLGVSSWLIYGLLLQELPIILANAATLSMALIILALKIRYG